MEKIPRNAIGLRNVSNSYTTTHCRNGVCNAHPRSGSVVVLVLRVIRHITHSSLHHHTHGGGGGVRDDSGSYRGAHDRGDDSDGCSILTLTSTSTLIWWFEPNSPVKGSPNIKGSFFYRKIPTWNFIDEIRKKKKWNSQKEIRGVEKFQVLKKIKVNRFISFVQFDFFPLLFSFVLLLYFLFLRYFCGTCLSSGMR